MNCKRCGTQLLDTDTFCVGCGLKVDAPMVCPSCKEILRDGTRFCHSCGVQVFAETAWQKASMDEDLPIKKELTTEIPFEAIEQGILMEAEQAVKKREVVETVLRAAEAQTDTGNQSMPVSGNYIAKNYEEYDTFEDDEPEEFSALKKLTTILGILIVLVAVGVGIWYWKTKYIPTHHENLEEQQETESEEDVIVSENGLTLQGRIQILTNVNIRNHPDKDNSKVLFVGKPGETYQYFELVDDAWYHVWLEDGSEGYVYKDYVENLSE